MRLPDADGFLVAAQKALGDREVVFLHNAEGAPVAAIIPIVTYNEKVDTERMPDHIHIEPGADVPWHSSSQDIA